MKLTLLLAGKKTLILAFTLLSMVMVKAQKAMVSPKQKALELLQKNLPNTGLNQSDLNNYIVSDAYIDKRSGNFLVYLQQAHLGVPVYNKLGIYIFRDDKLIEKKADYIAKVSIKAGKKLIYNINPQQAVRFAANHLGITALGDPQILKQDTAFRRFTFNPSNVSRENITSDMVWLPINNGAEIKLCWNIRIASTDSDDDWFVRVDANSGQFLEKNNLTVFEQSEEDECEKSITAYAVKKNYNFSLAGNYSRIDKLQNSFSPPAATSASYRVYAFPLESPNFGSRTLDTDPWLRAGLGNDATTLGWHFDNTDNFEFTRGNNVWAQEDIAGASLTTGFSDTSITPFPTLTFDKNLNPATHPTASTNVKAAITNLFYWNNIMHDISYQYGFNEAAGNFQTHNSGRGGLGDDFVNAFAQDGAGTNNANFATPPDGFNPRMRMYLFRTANVLTFHVNSPAPIAISYTAVESNVSFKNKLSYNGAVTADVVLVEDNPPGTNVACSFITNGAALAGKIALINRGMCGFGTKIRVAQDHGAIGVIIVNNVPGPPIVMTGLDTTLTVPAVMISDVDGTILKSNLTGLNVTMSATGGFYTDGDLDNGIIAHEYTHGISNRLTGGPSNVGCLVNAEQMGEGWSDYFALMTTTDWATALTTDGTKNRTIATYAVAQPSTGGGIRIYPYNTDMSVNPWNYSMLATSTGGNAHRVGEPWCATIWDMTWNIIQQEGIDPDIYRGNKGNNIALQLVMEGMKYQPCSPGFLDARDAILKADSILYNYAHKCAIWNAFARRGMGKSAVQGSSNSYTDQVAAYDLPGGLGISKSVNKSSVVSGDNLTYTIKAYCDCTPISNIKITDTLATTLNYVSSSGGSYTSPYVHFDGLNFAANETKTFTIQANVNASYTAPVILIDDSRDPATYTWNGAAITGATNWLETTARSHSGSRSWFAKDEGSPTDFTLTSGNLALDTISTLSFWHYFDTESAYDGGVVEISADGGSSWNDLGEFMTQNPYNNTLDPFSTGIGNRKAFSGSSGGFIQTIISLTGFAGTTVQIRFRFTSDMFVGSEGWYIDDIVLKNEHGINNIAYAFDGANRLSRNNALTLFAATAALPVNFLSFEAQKQNANAILHWKVNGEINHQKYIIERSADGARFSMIGEIAAGSASELEKDYYYTDYLPLKGSNFYRIVQKDKDGKSTISIIRQLKFISNDITIKISPVPTYNHSIQVDIDASGLSGLSGELVNTVGQSLKTFALKQGVNTLDLQNLSKGIYFIKIYSGSRNIDIRKLMIQ